jgi:prepilin-type processing-associated H-X9-DG protein
MDHSGGSKIPLMADALWYTGRPESCDLPPEEEGQFGQESRSEYNDSMDSMPGMLPMMQPMPTGEPNGPMMMGMPGFTSEQEFDYAGYNSWPDRQLNHMRRFTVNRHKEKLNVLFMDGMVKTISPKELWRLKWHKSFDTGAPLPEWPEWMARFKDPK